MDTVSKKKAKLGVADLAKLKALKTVPRSLPSAAERSRLQRLCNDRLSWSDGGHWIGGGPEPNCFQNSSIQGGITYVYEFPSDQAAFKWNAEWEKAIRYMGHLASAVVTTIVTIKTGGSLVSLWGLLRPSLRTSYRPEWSIRGSPVAGNTF